MKKITTTALAAALLLAGGMAAATESQAWATDCPEGAACIYVDANWIGKIGTKWGWTGLSNVDAAANDRTSSFDNWSDAAGAWYKDINGTGTCFQIPPRGADQAMSWWDQDSLSSWRMNGPC